MCVRPTPELTGEFSLLTGGKRRISKANSSGRTTGSRRLRRGAVGRPERSPVNSGEPLINRKAYPDNLKNESRAGMLSRTMLSMGTCRLWSEMLCLPPPRVNQHPSSNIVRVSNLQPQVRPAIAGNLARLPLSSQRPCGRSSRFHSLWLSRPLFVLKIRSTLPSALGTSTLSWFWVTPRSAGRLASNWKVAGTCRVRPTRGSGMSR